MHASSQFLFILSTRYVTDFIAEMLTRVEILRSVKLLPSTSKSALVRLVNFEPMEGALLHTMLYVLTNLQIWRLHHSASVL